MAIVFKAILTVEDEPVFGKRTIDGTDDQLLRIKAALEKAGIKFDYAVPFNIDAPFVLRIG